MVKLCYVCQKNVDEKNNFEFNWNTSEGEDGTSEKVLICDNCGKRMLSYINTIKISDIPIQKN